MSDPTHNYLSPDVLAQIGGLELRARLLVTGFISGLHRSPAHGFSVEFAEHRKYVQGDDLRYMDWKVYGRTDKHYVKQYEQESNLKLVFAVDRSESMAYRSAQAPWSKWDYAITIVAAMAYLAVQQSDSVGLAMFDTKLHRGARPSNQTGKWRLIVQELCAARTTGRTAFRGSIDELAETLKKPHLVVIVSDFFGAPDEVVASIRRLFHRGHEPVVMQVLDPAELTFPFEAPLQLVGLEGLAPVRVEPRVVRDRYLEELRGHTNRLRRCCHEQRSDYQLFDTAAPLGGVLSAYLAARSARARRWG